MKYLISIWNNIVTHFENQEIYPTLILSVLFMVTILAVYEFFVYRMILRRSLYNMAFNICISVVPYFIAMIILCLQSNMIVTLGTIGALAIIRFRTAIKDPIDMIFLLWSIFIGISCGCQIYSMSIITSLVVTVVLLGLNYIKAGGRSHVLVVHVSDMGDVADIEKMVKEYSGKYRIKSRNVTRDGINIVFELFTKSSEELSKVLTAAKGIERFSLMEYDPDDIL